MDRAKGHFGRQPIQSRAIQGLPAKTGDHSKWVCESKDALLQTVRGDHCDRGLELAGNPGRELRFKMTRAERKLSLWALLI